MNKIYLVLLPFLLACSLPAADDLPPVGGVQNVVLLRHAEKEAGVPDPGLTAAGHARAEFIAGWLGDPERHIEAIWSSDYRRTRETAQPLADRLGLEVRLYDPRDLPGLAARLRNQEFNAVVIGHSNTTPELASLLCECEVPAMPETDYETFYRLFRTDDGFGLLAVDLLKTWVDRPAPPD